MLPYPIAGLRERDYPAGKIRVGALLLVADAFTRYPITYDSDDLFFDRYVKVP